MNYSQKLRHHSDLSSSPFREGEDALTPGAGVPRSIPVADLDYNKPHDSFTIDSDRLCMSTIPGQGRKGLVFKALAKQRHICGACLEHLVQKRKKSAAPHL
jgi:hypothetical protein